MKFAFQAAVGLLLLGVSSLEAAEGKNLFILAGQSNMALFNPDRHFTPLVEERFGKDEVIVVKDAKGGEPIWRWVKNWKGVPGGPTPPEGEQGDLYERLIGLVRKAITGQKIGTVTFIWMQGESDAQNKTSDVYAASLNELLGQLKNDLGRDDVNLIVGRISDFDVAEARFGGHWIKVREAQVSMAESTPGARWIDTDDLNDGLNVHKKQVTNDLHYVVEGFKTLGQRYAAAAIELIEKRKGQAP